MKLKTKFMLGIMLVIIVPILLFGTISIQRLSSILDEVFPQTQKIIILVSQDGILLEYSNSAWISFTRVEEIPEFASLGKDFAELIPEVRYPIGKKQTLQIYPLTESNNQILIFHTKGEKQNIGKLIWKKLGLLLLLLIVLITLGAFVFVTKAFQPLSKLSKSIQLLLDGDLEQDLNVSRGDEVGELASYFVQLQQQTREKIEGLNEEIVKRIKAESAQGRLLSILEATPDYIGIADPSGRTLYMNSTARELLGIDGMEGSNLFNFNLMWADPVIQDEALPHAQVYGFWQGEAQLHTLTGQRIPVSQVVLAHKKSETNETVEYFSTIVRDMTEDKKAKEELQRAHDLLEARVEKRTRELQDINEKLKHEIEDRKQAQKDLEELQSQLVETAHRAGMADLATGILHNIGNVLNSINISCDTMKMALSNSETGTLLMANQLLEENLDNLPEYLSQDPKGQKLPLFYLEVGKVLQMEKETFNQELGQLHKSVEIIKEIVSTQQSYARAKGVTETVSLIEIMEEVLALLDKSLAHHNVQVIRKFSPIPPCPVQKVKLVQTLINLVKNAKESMLENDEENRILILKIQLKDEFVEILIQDQGMGISQENLTQIFKHGFTTKEDGHGFGLHTCANSVSEMGGSIRAESEGSGKGSRFCIQLPIKIKQAFLEEL